MVDRPEGAVVSTYAFVSCSTDTLFDELFLKENDNIPRVFLFLGIKELTNSMHLLRDQNYFFMR